jgi:hypothetical protein
VHDIDLIKQAAIEGGLDDTHREIVPGGIYHDAPPGELRPICHSHRQALHLISRIDIPLKELTVGFEASEEPWVVRGFELPATLRVGRQSVVLETGERRDERGVRDRNDEGDFQGGGARQLTRFRAALPYRR